MCGIFGYAGAQTSAADIVMNGLQRLDYRGYDSWGIAVCADNTITIEKKAGKIGEILHPATLPPSSFAIAHTRWATTGRVTDQNAHPHLASDASFALAHNGIIENYETLRDDLINKGYVFRSETDTECMVYLIEEKRKSETDILRAVAAAFQEAEGRNTILLLTRDNRIIAARNGSPLVIGLQPEKQEIFLSSDALSFAEYATKMIVVDNGQMVEVYENEVHISSIANGEAIPYEPTEIGFTNSRVDREGYAHFMLKEIHEAPAVLQQLIAQDTQPYELLAQAMLRARNVYTIGSGGAGVAAAQVAFYLRQIGKIRATHLIGSDAVEYTDLFTRDDIILAISQSGETADVLEVLEAARKNGVHIASFVNMPGSMISRISEYSFMSESGPEICVMSTKTFDAQIAFGYLLAKTIAGAGNDARAALIQLASNIQAYLKNSKNHEQLQILAGKLLEKHDIFLLGKYQNFHIIREGMVKIIEATYKHGHALPSGDLKHYVITLMEPGVAVIAVTSNDKTTHDVMNAVDEVRLRGAEVIGISPEPHAHFDYYLPVPDTGETSAMMNLIPLQLLAYYMAVDLGNNVDKPRNIAKSVTVK